MTDIDDAIDDVRDAAVDLLNSEGRSAGHVAMGVALVAPNGRFMEINDRFCEITGYSEAEVLGRNPRFLGSGRQSSQFYRAMWRDLLEKNNWRGEIWNKRKDGEIFPELLTISTVRDEQGSITHYIGVFIDITERKKEEDKNKLLADTNLLSEASKPSISLPTTNM